MELDFCWIDFMSGKSCCSLLGDVDTRKNQETTAKKARISVTVLEIQAATAK